MSKKSVTLSTGNKRKLGEAKQAAKIYDIEVKQVVLEIPEIQSVDPLKVSEHKVRSAFALIKKPVVVSDASWNIPAYNGFPGAYLKDVKEWFSEQDFINLMANKKDKRIAFSENISFYDGKTLKQFRKEYWGNFVDQPRGKGNSIENVVEFDGITLGERREQGGFSHKPEDYVWSEFFDWYKRKGAVHER